MYSSHAKSGRDAYSGSDRPRLRQWHPIPTPADDTEKSDYLLHNMNQILGKKDDFTFPEIQEGASMWYRTIDRLSKKITTQRHELWDVQSKLRIEVEKNRDLAKIIKADRREHKEVVAALTDKISSLERQLEEAREGKRGPGTTVPVTTDQPAIEIPKVNQAKSAEVPDQSQTISANSGEKSPRQGESSPYLMETIAGLYSQINSLTLENLDLRRQLTRQTDPAIDNLKTEDGPGMERKRSMDLRESKATESGLPKTAEVTTKAVSNEKKPIDANANSAHDTDDIEKNRGMSDEFKMLLASNKELGEKMRSQNEEFNVQQSRYNELHGLVEVLLDRLSQQPVTSQPASYGAGKNVPANDSHGSPKFGDSSSISASTISEDESHSYSHSTVSSTASSPRPLQQSSMNQSNITMGASTTASSTSTPAFKLRPLSRSNDIKRLDALYEKLKHGKLDQAELDRYDEIYRNTEQALAERPQLHAEVKQLIGNLQKETSAKHSSLLSRIQNDLY